MSILPIVISPQILYVRKQVRYYGKQRYVGVNTQDKILSKFMNNTSQNCKFKTETQIKCIRKS